MVSLLCLFLHIKHQIVVQMSSLLTLCMFLSEFDYCFKVMSKDKCLRKYSLWLILFTLLVFYVVFLSFLHTHNSDQATSSNTVSDFPSHVGLLIWGKRQNLALCNYSAWSAYLQKARRCPLRITTQRRTDRETHRRTETHRYSVKFEEVQHRL